MEIKYQVFVSSTYEDLKEERKEITQAILESHCIPAGMELFPASNLTQWDIIKRVIDDSDFYMLIIAGKYGSTIKDGSGREISYTEMEFDYALSSGKPILALVHEDIDALPRAKTETTEKKASLLSEFRKKVYVGRIIKKWTTKDNLKSAALAALSELKISTDAPGWVRADYKIDQQMYEFVEQQRLKFEAEIRELQSSLKKVSIEIEEKTTENEKLNNSIDVLSDELERLTNENQRLSQALIQKIDFWTCLLRINTAYEYITDTSERLLNDISKERPLSDSEHWFLKNHSSRSLWKSIMGKTDSILQNYENFSNEQKCAHIEDMNLIIAKYSSKCFDPYVMSDEETLELISNLFFLLKLCERYKFSDQYEQLYEKASAFISLCDSLIKDSWEIELALCDNDY